MKGQYLSQGQAAALAGITARRLRQMDHEPSPPPKAGNGRYPAAEFARWLAKSNRLPPEQRPDAGDILVGDIVGAFSKLCGCVLEGSEARGAFLGMCLHHGLSKRDALIAYAMQTFGMLTVGAQASDNPDWGIELPTDGFLHGVSKAIADKTLDQFIAENWPDAPAKKTK